MGLWLGFEGVWGLGVVVGEGGEGALVDLDVGVGGEGEFDAGGVEGGDVFVFHAEEVDGGESGRGEGCGGGCVGWGCHGGL